MGGPKVMDTEAIKTELSLIAICVSRISKLIQEETVVLPAASVSSEWYTSTDKYTRPFPEWSQWLTLAPTAALTYAQGRCWWAAEEFAKALGRKLIILNACPLDVESKDSPGHRPCSEPGGGRMLDIEYPVAAYARERELDIYGMKAIVHRFLEICVPIPDSSTNESEIRMGSDVFGTLGMGLNRNIQIDDEQFHRFDAPIYSHFHFKDGRL
jgi:hypothetical protein